MRYLKHLIIAMLTVAAVIPAYSQQSLDQPSDVKIVKEKQLDAGEMTKTNDYEQYLQKQEEALKKAEEAANAARATSKTTAVSMSAKNAPVKKTEGIKASSGEPMQSYGGGEQPVKHTQPVVRAYNK